MGRFFRTRIQRFSKRPAPRAAVKIIRKQQDTYPQQQDTYPR